MKRFAVLPAIVSAAAVLFFTSFAFAKTLVLEGSLDSSINMRQQMQFSVDKGRVQTLTFRFALPADYQSKSVSQSIDSVTTRFEPQPSSNTVEKDKFGNSFQKVSWSNVNESIRINLGYTANIHSELSAMDSRTIFPIGKISGNDAVYLQSTDMVQSDKPEILNLARKLVSGAKNEYEAVTIITNYVADNIKYTFNPPNYDALYTLRTKSGNCQNFAHLSIALLRSIGIPARIVGGITLKDSWKVPIDARNSIVQSMGQGGHAWMEIYFPDLGWLSYDPQQSRQFTSSRHIKQTHGLDSRDINDTWRGAPYLPGYSELVEGTFQTDDIRLKVKSTGKNPRPYIISNQVATNAVTIIPVAVTAVPDVAFTDKPDTFPAVVEEDADTELKVEKPVKVVKPKVKPAGPKVPVARVVSTEKKPVKPVKPIPGTAVLFGNMDFPNLVNGFSVQGDTGTRILDKETSEYVSSQYIYAQAIHIKDPFVLNKISLAMRKFGGDGSIYVDLVRDDGNGKPNILNGIRSELVSLENLSRKPGYYWVDFKFIQDAQSKLKPGKYWIVFRSSGEAIMNWFYIPGKPYGDSDDTRSTAKGFQWEDILSYDFVFKVAGKTL